MSTSNLKNWPIFSFLDSDFISNIHMVFVYGDLGNEALIVTKDKMVYALGNNTSGCLGIGDTNSTLYPRKVEELCNQNVTMFTHGIGPYVLALTEEGKVYSWGCNARNQLGNSSTDPCLRPTCVTKNISCKFIVSIACGSRHSLVLSSDGNVFAWGENTYGQVGNGDTTNVTVCTPKMVNNVLSSKRVVCISCCHLSSVAVTDKGEVYSWGQNNVGQLGNGNTINGYVPSKVAGLAGVEIEKVVCGCLHVLALSNKGVLYVWGENCFGQLGIGNNISICSPKKLIVKDWANVLDIAASHCSHMSAAMVEGSEIYVWGECLGQRITVPTLTNLRYLHDAFARYALDNIMPQPLVYDGYQEDVNVIDCFREAFDDNTTSDLVIEVQEQCIYVHKAVLIIRCEYFRKNLIANNQSVIKEEEFLYDAYRAFLKYLYTDEIDLDQDHMAELLKIAIAYSENELRKRCILNIQESVTVKRALLVYNIAIEYNEPELEEYCFKYALNHMSAVVLTESFTKLNEHMMKSFIIKVAQAGAFRT
ncbi:RCC1 and BTB domain-containing protein 1 [Eufriesea mexicana]|uniref:RCC1 and BTB domain-containing protein 1 n=1 Tax=Eufriesea mexicana TaxID=516756 RepID=A0A310SHE1_9HYME|nr:PREDICTED: RCC1 and BTB domain-containing protein 1-like [Eufriesea mexicana]OAD53000.1 RCC1 and BTB domain-containing protein 1 [Eufriesea mexicana]